MPQIGQIVVDISKQISLDLREHRKRLSRFSKAVQELESAGTDLAEFLPGRAIAVEISIESIDNQGAPPKGNGTEIPQSVAAASWQAEFDTLKGTKSESAEPTTTGFLDERLSKLENWIMPEGVEMNNIQRLQRQCDDLRKQSLNHVNRIYAIEQMCARSGIDLRIPGETAKQVAESELEIEKANAVEVQRRENERFKKEAAAQVRIPGCDCGLCALMRSKNEPQGIQNR